MSNTEIIAIIKDLIMGLFASHKTIICPDDIEEISLDVSDILRFYKTTSGVIKTSKGFFRPCFDDTNSNERLIFYDELSKYIDIDKKTKDFLVQQGTISYRRNFYHIQPNTYNANRIMATEKMAELLGLYNMVPHSRFVYMKIEGVPSQFGILMEFAQGIYPLRLGEGLKDVITPLLQRSLNNLNVIDMICNDKDHRPGNYFLVLNEKGLAVDICAFDNDSPWCFFPFFSLKFSSYLGSSSLVKRNKYMRPFIDIKVLEKIQCITRKKIIVLLSPFMNRLQVLACWFRIKGLRRFINKSVKNGDLKPLREGEWSEKTMQYELSGKFGKTYLTILHEWYETAKTLYPEIFTMSNFNLYD